MPRLIPPPIIVPPRSKPPRSPPLSPITPPCPSPASSSSSTRTFFVNDKNQICTIRNDMQVVLLICYHRTYIRSDCLYATVKDVKDKNRNPLLRYSLIWGISKWNPVQACSLNELHTILADCRQ